MASFASQREKLLSPEPDVLLTHTEYLLAINDCEHMLLCFSISLFNLPLLKWSVSITLTSSVQQYNLKHHDEMN